jgi:hypothetical protein
MTFALYLDQEGGSPLWLETQNVSLDPQGRYTALLGATSNDGLPLELFTSGEARWLGIQVQGQREQPRVLLAAVPYALRAEEAQRLAGREASEFLLAEQLESDVQQVVETKVVEELEAQGLVQQVVETKVVEELEAQGLVASEEGVTPAIVDGASTFTDSNATQVVQVTQNGTGKAVNAASTTGNTIEAESTGTSGTNFTLLGINRSTGGRALFGFASATSGNTIAAAGRADSTAGIGFFGQAFATSGQTVGVQAEVRSPSGIAGVFANTAGGPLLEGRSQGQVVFSVDGNGKIEADGTIDVDGLRTETNATSPNVIGGFSGNSVTGGVVGATIGGGGLSGFINQVTANSGTVGGGSSNTASGLESTVGGGDGNTASGSDATVGGGFENTASGSVSTVGGGDSNTASNTQATVGGGFSNEASGFRSTVPGGLDNTAGGQYSFAAGRRARANANGSFVWGDSTDADVVSSAVNEVTFRASGGFRIRDASSDIFTVDGSGNVTATSFSGDGSGLSNVGVTNAWGLTGNAGTTAGTNFLGTTDSVALELHVDSGRALRVEPTFTAPNLIGGFSGNTVTSGVEGGTVSGGGTSGLINQVTDTHGTVGGGRGNQAGNAAGGAFDSLAATVGGGSGNTASGGSSTVAGGSGNTASGFNSAVGGGVGNTASGTASFVGGGESNTASGSNAAAGGGFQNSAGGSSATVAGGSLNATSNTEATVGGGRDNAASGSRATVPGGFSNDAAGDLSFAAGRRAKANHQGAFVWGDSTDADVPSSAANEFTIRASGGFRMVNASNTELFTISGTGSTTITNTGGTALTATTSNTGANATGVRGFNTAATGNTIGVWGDVTSGDGVAGLFSVDVTTPGLILEGQKGGVTKLTVDGDGNLVATGNLGTNSTSGNLVIAGTGNSSIAGGLLVDTTTLVVDATNDRVGIGTASPGQLLHVSRADDGIVARFTDSNGSCDVDPTNTALICASDLRLKENISTLEGALAKVLQLRGVNYNWVNAENDSNHVGFIAQEVEALYPELVSTNEDGYKSLNYAGFTPILLQAIRELKTEKDGMEEKLEAQEEQAAALIAAVKEQQALLQEVQAELGALKAQLGRSDEKQVAALKLQE